jgi:hypothetical protein
MNQILLAAQQSGIFRTRCCRKAHLIHLPTRGALKGFNDNFDSLIKAHMAYVANTASTEVREITQVHRKSPVEMTPLEDGTIPRRPYNYTSIHRELTTLVDSDGRQIIDMAVPILSGPNAGMTTIVFRQSQESEDIVMSFARAPAAWMFHVTHTEKGFREDAAIKLSKSFDAVARGMIPSTTWDSETWTVSSPLLRAQDNFAEQIAEEGYELTDANLQQHHNPTISRAIAEQDVELVKRMQLSDDATFAMKDGVSVLSDATHATMGVSSVRTENTQDFQRNLEARCIAEAERMEKAANERWRDIAAAATQGGTGLCSPLPAEDASNSFDRSTNVSSSHTPAPNSRSSVNNVSPESQSDNHPNTSVPPTGEPASI